MLKCIFPDDYFYMLKAHVTHKLLIENSLIRTKELTGDLFVYFMIFF